MRPLKQEYVSLHWEMISMGGFGICGGVVVLPTKPPRWKRMLIYSLGSTRDVTVTPAPLGSPRAGMPAEDSALSDGAVERSPGSNQTPLLET